MALSYANEKQRLNIQKKLEKRQQQADKVAAIELKKKKDHIKKFLGKSLEKIARNQNEKKTDAREAMSHIKEYEEEQREKDAKIRENKNKKI